MVNLNYKYTYRHGFRLNTFIENNTCMYVMKRYTTLSIKISCNKLQHKKNHTIHVSKRNLTIYMNKFQHSKHPV